MTIKSLIENVLKNPPVDLDGLIKNGVVTENIFIPSGHNKLSHNSVGRGHRIDETTNGSMFKWELSNYLELNQNAIFRVSKGWSLTLIDGITAVIINDFVFSMLDEQAVEEKSNPILFHNGTSFISSPIRQPGQVLINQPGGVKWGNP